MLPKGKRIRRGSEIKQILRTQRPQYNSPRLSITTRENNNQHSKLAVICGSKVGGAVIRNRARRKINGIISNIWHKIAKNIDIVIAIRKTEQMKNQYFNDLADWAARHA